MISPRAPVYLTHAPTPKVEHFAMIAACEAGVRGTLLSAMPLAIIRAFDDAGAVSLLYFCVGVASLVCGLLIPSLTQIIPRRWAFTLAPVLYFVGLGMAIAGTPLLLALALLCNAVATVTFSVCINAYVLDYITRTDLGRNESMRMVYSAAPWMIGPVLGVFLLDWWYPAPFLLAGVSALALLVVFWVLRLGNGKQITRARAPAPNPLAYLHRFGAQPRLIAGWLFAVIRSSGWWVYVVYLPIYCIENGLGDRVGGIALSLSNGLLFLTPLMLRRVTRIGVRRSVYGSFVACGALFLAGFAFSGLPWAAVTMIGLASVLLVMLDVCGSLPFLMAVKPSERTEMSAVYATFRDASGIATPGVAWLLLLVAPVSTVFAACGVAMLAAAGMASRLNPRLGETRVRPPAAEREPV